MNKKTILALTILLIFTSCSKKEQQDAMEPSTVEVKDENPKKDEVNAKAMTFSSKIVMDNIDIKDMDIKVDNDSDYSNIEKGDFDIAIIPAYLGPYFYNSTNEGIEVAAISSIDNIKLVSDNIINDQNDLKGKNLYITDPVGNISKAIDKKLGPLNMYLKLNTEYYKNMNDMLKKVSESSNFLTIMTDPYYEKVIDKEYNVSDLSSLLSVPEDQFVSEIIIVNKNYLKENKKSFDKFLEAYKDSSKKVNTDPSISKDVLESYNLSEKQARDAINRNNPTFIEGNSMKETYNLFLDILASFDKSLLSDVDINNDFYYISK